MMSCWYDDVIDDVIGKEGAEKLRFNQEKSLLVPQPRFREMKPWRALFELVGGPLRDDVII